MLHPPLITSSSYSGSNPLTILLRLNRCIITCSLFGCQAPMSHGSTSKVQLSTAAAYPCLSLCASMTRQLQQGRNSDEHLALVQDSAAHRFDAEQQCKHVAETGPSCINGSVRIQRLRPLTRIEREQADRLTKHCDTTLKNFL